MNLARQDMLRRMERKVIIILLEVHSFSHRLRRWNSIVWDSFVQISSCHCYFAGWRRIIDCRYKSQNKNEANDYEFPLKSRSIEVWLSTRVNGFEFASASFTALDGFLSQAKETWKKAEQKTHRKLFVDGFASNVCSWMAQQKSQ